MMPRTPCNTCKVRNICNSLQTLICTVAASHSSTPLCKDSLRIPGSYSMVELFCRHNHLQYLSVHHSYTKLSSHSHYVEILMYRHMPTHNVLLRHFRRMLLLHTCILYVLMPVPKTTLSNFNACSRCYLRSILSIHWPHSTISN